MLNDKQRQDILDLYPDHPTMQKYIRKVFEEAPNLDNSVHIEGIANEWMYAVEIGRRKNFTFSDAVKSYEKTYREESAYAEKISNVKMPPLALDLTKPEQTYTVNEEMTATAIEAQKKLGNLLGAMKEFEETGALFDPDDEKERFFGTVVNEETFKKAQRANELLDLIELGSLDIKVEKFTEPVPIIPSALVAMTVHDINGIDGTTLAAFKELVELADDITIVPKDGNICRIAFAFYDLWKEHRTMSMEECAEFWGERFSPDEEE